MCCRFAVLCCWFLFVLSSWCVSTVFMLFVVSVLLLAFAVLRWPFCDVRCCVVCCLLVCVVVSKHRLVLMCRPLYVLLCLFGVLCFVCACVAVVLCYYWIGFVYWCLLLN